MQHVVRDPCRLFVARIITLTKVVLQHMAAIVTLDTNNVVEKTPWNIPHVREFFRANTWGGTVVMGRRTWESIGRLPGRRNIVLSREKNIPGVQVLQHLDEVPHDAYWIGGADVFKQALQYNKFSMVIVARIHTVIKSTDAVVLSTSCMKCIYRSRIFTHKECTYHFEILINIYRNR